MRKVILLLVILPFVTAMQCDEDTESNLYLNNFKASVTPQMHFNVNDVIWINGRVSSKAFNTTSNDSVIYTENIADEFSILKCIVPNQNSNCKDAIDKFQLINEIGTVSLTGYCQNADLSIYPVLSQDQLSYKYKLGLKALSPGDYVISWTNETKLTNTDLNESIITNYPLPYHPNQIGFDKCGNTSWKYLNQSNQEFYFTVH